MDLDQHLAGPRLRRRDLFKLHHARRAELTDHDGFQRQPPRYFERTKFERIRPQPLSPFSRGDTATSAYRLRATDCGLQGCAPSARNRLGELRSALPASRALRCRDSCRGRSAVSPRPARRAPLTSALILATMALASPFGSEQSAQQESHHCGTVSPIGQNVRIVRRRRWRYVTLRMRRLPFALRMMRAAEDHIDGAGDEVLEARG